MAVIRPDELALLLAQIRDGLCACLADQATLGVPKDCFISHGEPADDCCDFLAVWVQRTYPTRRFPEPWEGTTRCEDVGIAIEFGVRLMRPCFPTLVDNAFNPFPDGEDSIEPAAIDLLIDAWVLECCLLDVGAAIGFPCREFKMGELIPEGPRGGCAGWTLSGTIETRCCAPLPI
jgi:hypothetical protein